jgi:glycosyltransferase involved in cell wall biosynthesis
VFEVRDLWPETLAAMTGRTGPAYLGMKGVADYLYRRADRIIVLARGVQAYLVEAGAPAEKVVYLPNGTRVNGSAAGTAARTSRPPFRLVYAGAHGPANGLESVLEAASLLQGKAPVHFLLVGAGPSKPALVERARALGLSNVEFRPPVPKAEIQELLAGCSAGLMVLRDTPLFSFGVSPNKLFDYLGAGIPVVSNVPGEVSAMLQDAEAGVQAEGKDGKSLAAAVLRFTELDEDTRLHMGRSGQRWVARNHSFDVLADQLDPVLRELAHI